MARFRQRLALVLSLTLSASVALAEQPAASGLYDQPVLVVDPGMHTAPIRRADADRDGRWAVTGSLDKTVWSVADGALLRTIRLPAGPGGIGQARAVAISPDGVFIAVGGWTRWAAADQQEQIYLFDRASGALVKRIEALPSTARHLVFSPDGRRLTATLAVGDRDRAWDETARDTNYGDDSYGAAFAPDGRLATTALDGNVRLYADRKPISVISSPASLYLPTAHVSASASPLLEGIPHATM